MSELRRTAIGKAIENFVIESGANMPSSPVDICKIGFQIIKDKKEENFINDVLNNIKDVSTSDFSAEKSLERLYKVTQVIAKATTQDKINRFKKLTINGIINQNEISENNYELYLRIIDELTDEEFLYLDLLVKNIDKSLNFNNDNEENKELRQRYKQANEIIKSELNISDEKLNLYRNSMAGRGLINLAAAFGGLAFNNLSHLAYDLIEYINK